MKTLLLMTFFGLSCLAKPLSAEPVRLYCNLFSETDNRVEYSGVLDTSAATLDIGFGISEAAGRSENGNVLSFVFPMESRDGNLFFNLWLHNGAVLSAIVAMYPEETVERFRGSCGLPIPR